MQNYKSKFKILRKKYSKFVYQNYFYRISKRNLEIFFDFRIEPDIKFHPKIIIKNIPQKLSISDINKFNNLIFHLGLMEIPSYWKATCSPRIEIWPGFLNSEQTKWWKDLIIRGMGQFFYENKIDFREPNFINIKITPTLKINKAKTISVLSKNKILVPIGGGKDSIVTLEKLKKRKEKIGCFLVNPTKAMKKIVRVAGIKDSVIVKREIDPALLELNKKGYLNGHTPITAVFSFLSILAAVLFNYKNIAFSNEKSADEGNVRYLGKIINHQWSKSSEFERKFKNYCQKYLAKNINYFSLLRPYTELEISKMFLKYPQYFSVFSSCNVGQKTGKRWCGNCPKCLFVYATLYPFLERKQLLKIFGTDIFENRKLLPTMKGLLGQGRPKPFECVGTKRESRIAFSLSLKKAQQERKIPFLLTATFG
ncbi:MAG: hypothetical protein QME57_00815 [Patescibacteria group bacterium]|nr:hypothetical protein [Patescibacteria group bacterium]